MKCKNTKRHFNTINYINNIIGRFIDLKRVNEQNEDQDFNSIIDIHNILLCWFFCVSLCCRHSWTLVEEASLYVPHIITCCIVLLSGLLLAYRFPSPARLQRFIIKKIQTSVHDGTRVSLRAPERSREGPALSRIGPVKIHDVCFRVSECECVYNHQPWMWNFNRHPSIVTGGSRTRPPPAGR